MTCGEGSVLNLGQDYSACWMFQVSDHRGSTVLTEHVGLYVLNLSLLFCCSGIWKKLTFLSTLSRVMKVSSTALMGVEVLGSEPQR